MVAATNGMWAYELRGSGLEGLALTTRALPEPGHGQVLVRVRATSLNYRDLGQAAARREQPLVPLSDGAGEVVEVGPGVTRWHVGDQVVASFFEDWTDGDYEEPYGLTALGGAVDGMLAEYVVRREAALVAIPPMLSFEEAATLPCAGVTAWVALFGASPLRPGQSVLVQGTGGVSIYALQLARTAGAQVIATSRSDDKLDRAKALGAALGVNTTTTPAWHEEVVRLTGGRGVDHIVEVAATLASSLRAVATNGTINVIGGLGQPDNQPDLSRMTMLRKHVRVHGIYVGSTAHLRDLARAMEANDLHPVIGATFPHTDARAAYELMSGGAHLGKIVITC